MGMDLPRVALPLNGAAFMPIPVGAIGAWPKKTAKDWINAFAANHQVVLPPGKANPWLPLCSWEGLLVVGHFDPSGTEFCGIPVDLVVKVRLLEAAYVTLHDPCVNLFKHAANPKKPSIASLQLHEALAKAEFILKHGLAGKSSADKQPAEWLDANPLRRDLLDAGSRQPHFIPLHEANVQADIAARIQSEPHLQYVIYAQEPGMIHAVVGVSNKRRVHSAEADISTKLAASTPAGTQRPRVKVALASDETVSALLINSQGNGAHSAPARLNGADQEWAALDRSRQLLTIPREMSALHKPMPEYSPRELFMWAIAQGVARRGSDIHAMFDIAQAKGLLRMRCDGVLITLVECQRELINEIVNVVKRATGLSTDYRFPESGKLRAQIGDQTVNLRIETCPGTPDAAGPGVELLVVRILTKNASLSTLQDLNTSQWNLEMLRNLIGTDQGIIFATGPTGSGKSSTLSLMLKEAASPEVNTLKIENPVEQPTAFAHHIEIDDSVKDPNGEEMSFARAMRSAVRLDPDIIEVGEIRDKSTSDLAIQASQTGHLVFTTAHTNSALDVFSRLESLGANSRLVIDATVAVMAQRLVRVLCPHCHTQKRSANDREIQMVVRATEKLESTLLNPICPDGPAMVKALRGWLKEPKLPQRPENTGYHCPHCNNGVLGRRAVIELFPTFEGTKLRDLLTEGVPISALIDHVLSEGYLTVRYDTLRLVIEGIAPFTEYTAKAPQFPSNALRT